MNTLELSLSDSSIKPNTHDTNPCRHKMRWLTCQSGISSTQQPIMRGQEDPNEHLAVGLLYLVSMSRVLL